MIYLAIVIYVGIGAIRALVNKHGYEEREALAAQEDEVVTLILGPSAGTDEVIYRHDGKELRRWFHYYRLTTLARILLGVIWPWSAIDRIWQFVASDSDEPPELDPEDGPPR